MSSMNVAGARNFDLRHEQDEVCSVDTVEPTSCRSEALEPFMLPFIDGARGGGGKAGSTTSLPV